jgi:hypothetical protein
MKKPHVTLTDADHTTLGALLAKGALPAKIFKRVTALVELNRGEPLSLRPHHLHADHANDMWLRERSNAAAASSHR